MISVQDLQKIYNRDADIEVLRRTGARKLGPSFFRQWDWERKYMLSFSVPIKREELEAAWQLGMLRKEDLDEDYYWGICRGARVAKWIPQGNRFLHMDFNGAWIRREISYPSDEGVAVSGERGLVGFDIFIPWVRVKPLEFERLLAY